MKLETVEDMRSCIVAGMAAMDREDWAAAEKLLDPLLARHPSEPVALYLRGVVHFQQKNWPSAEEFLRKALAIAPDQLQVALQLAQTLRAAQRPGEALEVCRRILAAHPNDIAAWLELGKAQEESGAMAAAEASYRHALAKTGDPAATINLAQLLIATNRSVEAEALLRQALAN